ncbi:MAG TPA: hypothetical protein VFN42_00070, partial [Acetobacteraceae bacterium]|nr:hypothetical protein [Acetobacteraceae bacterium]
MLPRLADRAIDPLRRWLLTRHLAQCSACAAQFEDLLAMQAALRTALPYHRAPPGLAARIGAALPQEAPPASGVWRRRAPWRMAGSGLAGVVAGVALTLLVMPRPAPRQALIGAAVAD